MSAKLTWFLLTIHQLDYLLQVLGILVLMAISLTSTYVLVMLVDLLFGFRVSRACELIGLDTCRVSGSHLT